MKTKDVVIRCALLAVTLICPSTAALAATATGNITVSATITDSCSISPQPLNFGSIEMPITTPVDAQTAIAIDCDIAPAVANITISGGLHPNRGVVNLRAMATPNPNENDRANFLAYQLFTDSNRTNEITFNYVWNVQGANADQVIPLYGRVPTNQTSRPGNYTDSLVVTLTYDY